MNMSEHASPNGDIDRITHLLNDIGGLERVEIDEDFYDAGFSSIGSLQLLLELESAWSVSIPDDEFIQARTPRALHALLMRLSEVER
jgi:acyl carrier protein